MYEIIKTHKLGEYEVVLEDTKETNQIGTKLFDVSVRNSVGRTIVTLHHNCWGEKSGNHWFNEAVEYMHKILLLVEQREMALHNMYCYSTNLACDTPKDGYEDKWKFEKERANVIEKWLVDLSNYYGKEDERGRFIRLEWDIDEIFVEEE